MHSFLRKLAPAVVLTSVLTMTAAPIAFAKALHGFNIRMDVPDDWSSDDTLSQSPDKAYSFKIGSSAHGNHAWTASDADAFAIARAQDSYNGKMKDAVIETHARAVEYGPFVGFEVYGHATTAGKEPGNFYVTVLQKKDQLSVACWTIGFGATAASQKYQPIAVAAVKGVTFVK